MKILEPQAALLTNYEAFLHIRDVQTQIGNRQFKKYRKNADFQTVMKELTNHFKELYPHFSAQTNPPPPNELIRQLLQRLKQYELTKVEVLMLINLRPKDEAVVYPVIEEIEERFSETQIREIVDIVRDVLLTDEEKEKENSVEDEEMAEEEE